MSENRHKDVKGSIAAAGFILLGIVAWTSTDSMADPDSYVFPRAVIIVISLRQIRPLRSLRPQGPESGVPCWSPLCWAGRC